MGFPRQEYWSGLPFPPPEDLPNPGIKPMSPVAPALVGKFFITEPTGKPTVLLVFTSVYPSDIISGVFLFFGNDRTKALEAEFLKLDYRSRVDR